jgi:hypothetical protein
MRSRTYIYGLILIFSAYACVEPFDATSDIFSDTSMVGTLVVEANITDVEAIQKVFLSRMQRVESDSTVNVEEQRLFNVHTPIIIHRDGTRSCSGSAVPHSGREWDRRCPWRNHKTVYTYSIF